MRATQLIGSVFAASFVLGLGCSSSPSTPGGRTPGGSSGGQTGASSGASSVSSGGSSSVASGGTGVVVVSSGGSAGREAGCNDLTVVPKPVTPTVLILVDNSSSMFDTPMTNPPWPILYSALMDPASGVVKGLEDKVRFGFASFKGSTMMTTEDSPSCATITSVPYALHNYDAIDTVYTKLGKEWMPGIKWETPTGHAVNVVAADLAAFTADPPGPKYILLVTDGNPNTCEVVDPQCGSDLSVKAVQDAQALGIGTFVIGIGDIITGNTGCEPQWGRCGKDHLQDIANAGLGLPVQAPPAEYVWQSCADRYGRVLKGTYADVGGDAPYYTATSAAELTTALTALLNGVLSCTFDMNAIVTGNPALGTVMIDGNPLVYDAPDGWQLEPNQYQVTLVGAACEQFKLGAAKLDISFPCEVAVPR